MKLSSAAITASILDLNLLQDFVMVFLARDPITSLIKEIKSLILWPRFPLTLKGTVTRDFLLLVLFMNQFPPSPRGFH
jgi:hypothetical protein